MILKEEAFTLDSKEPVGFDMQRQVGRLFQERDLMVEMEREEKVRPPAPVLVRGAEWQEAKLTSAPPGLSPGAIPWPSFLCFLIQSPQAQGESSQGQETACSPLTSVLSQSALDSLLDSNPSLKTI